MNTPAVCVAWAKVSRALCPSASTTCSARIASPFSAYAADLSIVDVEAGDFALETDFAAKRDDFGAHTLDHADEAERTDVRVGDIEDFRRAGLDELGGGTLRPRARS